MKKSLHTKRCPLCNGKGKIIRPTLYKFSKKQQDDARKLFAKGFVLREIGEKIGVSHPQSVKNLIIGRDI